MGFGASKIDYKERNFTEQPLEEEEIEVLLKALPEENVIDSIDNDGREKILKAMSDQNVFNIRGDNIFDYYLTNKREIIKGCMTSHINRDGTPCPDEKFNRMITTIPNLVQGPLREKETEWDIERTGLKSKYNRLDTTKNYLQSQYDTLNTEKTDLVKRYNTLDAAYDSLQEQKNYLQSDYDTLQQKKQQNLEALALDGFLANPEMYNKMLMEKMSEKALNIFTKDGDIDINVKELVEHSSIKSTLERAHKEKRTHIPSFIRGFKTQASYLINQFKKEAADNVKFRMPPLAFLAPLIQMKIAAQYSGSDKTKIVPNRILYTTFPEFFSELGIEQNNIEYTLKFITFNTFKKFMDYDLKNNVKGIDLHLQDFLKLIKEFGGEEYLNSLSNFEVDTGLKGSYHTLNTEKTNLQSQYDRLNTEKTDLVKRYNTLDAAYDSLEEQKNYLQNQYDTLQQKRKQNLEALALDGFLANPEIYNKMLKEKISQKTLDIFTKDGDINIDVKETVEFKQFSSYFKMAYESKKSVLPQLVESLKKGSPSGLEQFKTKDAANYIIGTGNLMIIYFFYIYLMIKIILQYNSTDKKRVPNETVYNSFSEFFNELGIEEQQFEYVLKFIAFNTFKKFMDYGSNNNDKGIDIFLKDSLKIVEKFIGKEYVNSLANFDFNTDMIFDYVHTTSGEPNMSVSEEMCKLYMETKGYGFKSVNEKMGQSGCIFASVNSDGNKGFYNKASTNVKCSDRTPCVQKPPDVKNFVKTSKGNTDITFDYVHTTSGEPDMSVSEQMCKLYMESKGYGFQSINTNMGQSGCIFASANSDGNKGFYNKASTNIKCSDRTPCVQKPPDVKNFVTTSIGKPDFSVNKFECKAYADTHGHNYSLDNIKNNNGECQSWANVSGECTKNPNYMWGNCKKACYEKFSPKGCVIRGNDVWFNKKESDRKCGEQSINCIQK